jgi:uncharacterized phage infection (PIP) family protein YhgE
VNSRKALSDQMAQMQAKLEAAQAEIADRLRDTTDRLQDAATADEVRALLEPTIEKLRMLGEGPPTDPWPEPPERTRSEMLDEIRASREYQALDEIKRGPAPDPLPQDPTETKPERRYKL